MKLNIGPNDQSFRVVIGLLFVAVGIWQDIMILATVGLLIFATGMMSWCPIYMMFNIDTKGKKKSKKKSTKKKKGVK